MSEHYDEKRGVAHPRDAAVARRKAVELGLPVQITDMCPPGTVYVFDPSELLRDAR